MSLAYTFDPWKFQTENFLINHTRLPVWWRVTDNSTTLPASVVRTCVAAGTYATWCKPEQNQGRSWWTILIKNTTTQTPPQKHNHKNNTTKTPPQKRHTQTAPHKHHTNTTTPHFTSVVQNVHFTSVFERSPIQSGQKRPFCHSFERPTRTK